MAFKFSLKKIQTIISEIIKHKVFQAGGHSLLETNRTKELFNLNWYLVFNELKMICLL